jgi:hypothetical protein
MSRVCPVQCIKHQDTHTGSNKAITEVIKTCCILCNGMVLTIFLAYPVYIIPATVPAILEERQNSVNIFLDDISPSSYRV